MWYNVLMILFFDTETTGLSPGRIIQLSYIMQSDIEVKAKNFFFYVDYIEPSAAAVHGFTPEKLLVLSKGHTFSSDIDEIYDDFLSADVIVAHNLSFDLKFMIAEFAYHDRQFRYREGICSMRYFTDILKIPRASGRGYKYPKLTELSQFYDLYPYDVTMETAKLFGTYGQSHDARFDTTELYLSFNRAADGNGRIRNALCPYLLGRAEETLVERAEETADEDADATSAETSASQR